MLCKWGPAERGEPSTPLQARAQGEITLFAVAKASPVRRRAGELGPHAQLFLWNLDTEAEFLAACNEGAAVVISNRVSRLIAAAPRVKLRCAR